MNRQAIDDLKQRISLLAVGINGPPNLLIRFLLAVRWHHDGRIRAFSVKLVSASPGDRDGRLEMALATRRNYSWGIYRRDARPDLSPRDDLLRDGPRIR